MRPRDCFCQRAAATALVACAALVNSGCPPAQGPVRPPAARLAAPAAADKTVAETLHSLGPALDAGRFAEVSRTVQDILTVEPDHLEGWVIRALAADVRADGPASAEAWARVEQILVYQGQMEPFALQATLFGAAQHYLELRAAQRAELFADDLLRRFPTSAYAARLRLRQAEVAFADQRWDQVVAACAQLALGFPKHRELGRCTALSQRAQRLRDVGPGPDAGAGAWGWEWPQPQGNGLRAVWVGPRGEVVAVGETGTILIRRSGDRFERMASGTRWDLHAVAGTELGALFAVGAGGIVLAFDGQTWRTLRAPQANAEDLRGAYSAAPGHLVAVGARGIVLRSGPEGKLTSTTVDAADLRAVWGVGQDALFAAGDGGTLLVQRDGRWEKRPSDTYEDLWAVHGVSAAEVVAVGSKRTLVRYDGTRAAEEVVGLADLRAVWIGKQQRGWAVGRGGAILRLDGPRWRAVPSGTLLDLRAIAARSDGQEMWAVGDGGTILRERGGRWGIVAGGLRQRLVAVSAAARPPLALGEDGALLLRERRGRWTMQTLPVLGRYLDLWSDGRELAAVGRRGLLVVREAGAYRQLATGTPEDLQAVWSSGKLLVAVGTRGAVVRVVSGQVHRDLLPTGLDLHGVWGRVATSGPELFAVGARGTILRFDGAQWQEEASGTLADLHAVWGTGDLVVAVGDGGAILRRNAAGKWALEHGPAGQDLVDVWGVYASSIYAVARGGTVIRFDGQRWSVQDSPAACLVAIDGAADTGALAVGCHGSVLSAQAPR